MCPYCCTQGINTETLPSHIEDFHTLDEVEFLEAQVYSDMWVWLNGIHWIILIQIYKKKKVLKSKVYN